MTNNSCHHCDEFSRLSLLRNFEETLDPLSPHLRFFTRKSLSQVLDALGFDVESIKRKQGSLLVRATR